MDFPNHPKPFDGKCARMACPNMNFGYVHRDTGLLYCGACAKRINDACNKALCLKVRQFDVRIVAFPCGCADSFTRLKGTDGAFGRSDHLNCDKHPCPMYDPDAAVKAVNSV